MSDDFFDFFEDEEPIEPDFSLNEDCIFIRYITNGNKGQINKRKE